MKGIVKRAFGHVSGLAQAAYGDRFVAISVDECNRLHEDSHENDDPFRFLMFKFGVYSYK